MDTATRSMVRQRAGNRCEYCRILQEQMSAAAFHVDHIIPKQHGGSDDASNLALACYHCNLRKGPNLTGIDPDTGALVPLFHPRQEPRFRIASSNFMNTVLRRLPPRA